MIYHANSIQRKAGVAILSDKGNFRMKNIIMDKGHFYNSKQVNS